MSRAQPQPKLHYTQMNPYKVGPEDLERAYYKKAVPCFHCNRQLQYLPGKKLYVGFLVEGPDKIEHPIHGACITSYLLDQTENQSV